MMRHTAKEPSAFSFGGAAVPRAIEPQTVPALEKGNILKNEENLVRSKKLFQTNTKQVRTESRLQGVLPPLSTNCWSSIENEERAKPWDMEKRSSGSIAACAFVAAKAEVQSASFFASSSFRLLPSPSLIFARWKSLKFK